MDREYLRCRQLALEARREQREAEKERTRRARERRRAESERRAARQRAAAEHRRVMQAAVEEERRRRLERKAEQSARRYQRKRQELAEQRRSQTLDAVKDRVRDSVENTLKRQALQLLPDTLSNVISGAETVHDASGAAGKIGALLDAQTWTDKVAASTDTAKTLNRGANPNALSSTLTEVAIDIVGAVSSNAMSELETSLETFQTPSPTRSTVRSFQSHMRQNEGAFLHQAAPVMPDIAAKRGTVNTGQTVQQVVRYFNEVREWKAERLASRGSGYREYQVAVARARQREREAKAARERAARERAARERERRLAARREAERERRAQQAEAERRAERERRKMQQQQQRLANESKPRSGNFAQLLGEALRSFSQFNQRIERGMSRSRGSVGQSNGRCASGEAEMRAAIRRANTRMNRGNVGMCAQGRIARRVYSRALEFYQNCPINDPTGKMRQQFREMIQWGNEVEAKTCAR